MGDTDEWHKSGTTVALGLFKELEIIMYAEYRDSMREMRECGYAVVVFSPKELEGANNIDIEDEMCGAGLHLIDLFHDPDYKHNHSL